MMAAIGALADRLFEGQILLAALEQQGADRRIGIGPVEDHALADLQAGTPRDGVGGMPAGHGESMDQLGLGPDETDIDRVAGNAIRRGRHHLAGKGDVVPILEPPVFRRDEIGEQAIEDECSQQTPRGTF